MAKVMTSQQVKALQAKGKLSTYRNDPGLRSRLPTAALSKTQQAARKLNTALDAPAAAGSSITRRQLAKQVNTDATSQYGAQIGTAQTGVKSAQDAQVAQPGWFDAYRQAVAQAQAQNAAPGGVTDQSVAAQGGIANSAGQVAPGSEGDPTATAAAQVRQQLGLGVAKLAQLVGNNESDFIKNLGLQSYGQQATSANAAQNTVGAAQTNLGNVQAAQANFKTSDKNSILGEDAKAQQQAFANQIETALTNNTLATGATSRTNSTTTAATGAQNADTAAAGEKDSATSRAAALKASQKKFAETLNKYGVTNGAWAAWGKQGSAGKQKRDAAVKAAAKTTKAGTTTKPPRYGPGSLSQPQENTLYGKVDTAIRWAKKLKDAGTDQSTVRQILLTGHKGKTSSGTAIAIPASETWAVNAAMDLAYNGYLSAPNVKSLHARGLHVNGHYPTSAPKGKAGPGSAAGTIVGQLGAAG